MNYTGEIQTGSNISSTALFSSDPPPGAVWGWPGCLYPLPLPEHGHFYKATEWIWKTVPVCLILFGTVGNILTALVILRHFRKLSSTAVYLLTLAVTDTVFLFNSPFKRFLYHVFGIEIRNISDVGCKITMFLTYTSFHLSAWVLVAVTVERAVSVIWPYKVKRRCTQKVALFVTFGIIIAVFAINSHLIYGFGTSSLNMFKGFDRCMPVYDEYAKFYIYDWFWIHLFFAFVAPFLFIVIGNILVIRGLRKMRMRQKWMNDSNGILKDARGRHHRHGHHARTLMIILILLNTIFFISQTPVAIYLVYFPYLVDDINANACSDVNSYLQSVEKLWFWEAVTHTFGYLNASINFVLYVISGSRFRKEILSLLLCKHYFYMRSSSTISPSFSSQENSKRHQRQSRSSFRLN